MPSQREPTLRGRHMFCKAPFPRRIRHKLAAQRAEATLTAMMMINFRRVANAAFGLPVAVSILSIGCQRDVRLAGKKIPTVNVRPVTMYGMTLDATASPEQVAFAALQAVREDFGAKDAVEREAALARQFDLCAANHIDSRRSSSLERDEHIYNVVYRWTPTVSHYVGDFPTDWTAAQARLHRRELKLPEKVNGTAEVTEVAMAVKDPGGEPDASVVLLVWLARDEGLWRVSHFGFDRERRTLGAQSARLNRAAPSAPSP